MNEYEQELRKRNDECTAEWGHCDLKGIIDLRLEHVRMCVFVMCTSTLSWVGEEDVEEFSAWRREEDEGPISTVRTRWANFREQTDSLTLLSRGDTWDTERRIPVYLRISRDVRNSIGGNAKLWLRSHSQFLGLTTAFSLPALVSLEMSRSHSSLELCLEYYLYERATGVKLVLVTSNHSESDQSQIKDGDVLKTASIITFWHDKSPIEPRVLRQIFIKGLVHFQIEMSL